MKMVPPKRVLSESSLTSVADMIQDAFGDESENIIDLGFIKAILLIITRALSLLERKVAVKLYPKQHIPKDNNITIGEIKVSVKGPRKTKPSHTDKFVNEAIKQKFSAGSDKAKEPLCQYDQDSFLTKEASIISNAQAINEKEIKSHKKGFSQTKNSMPGTKFDKNENGISAGYKTENNDMKNLQSSDKSEKKEPSSDFITDKSGTISEKEGSKQTENLRPSNKSKNKETSQEYDKSCIVSRNEDSAQNNDLRSGDKSVKKESSPGYKSDDVALSNKNKAASEGTHKFESDKQVMPIATPSTFLKKVQQGKVNIGKNTNPSDTAETYHEKIYVVERRVTTGNNSFHGTTVVEQAPQSLVTTERFKALEEEVKQLQHRFSPIYSDLLPSLHRASSLSDPIAVLQLSARLEAVENAIYDMMDVLKKLHSTGSNLQVTSYNLPPSDHKMPLPTYSLPSTIYELPTTEQSEINLITIAEETVKKNPSLFLDIKVLGTDEVEALKLPDTQTILSNEYSRSSKGSKGSRASIKYKTDLSPIVSVVEFESSLPVASKARSKDTSNDNSNRTNDPSFLTYEELSYRMQKFAEAMNKQVQSVIDLIQLTSQKMTQDALILGVQQANIKNKLQLLQDLESEVEEFINSVNKIEAELNDKLSHYQSIFTSLESLVATKLENIADALSRNEPDNEAKEQLTEKFVVLRHDLNSTNGCQNKLHHYQNGLLKRIKVIQKQLIHLNNLKADRDKTEEALKCKANKALLNGIIDKDQFLALSAHWEKYVTDLVQNFDCQERGWQKRINHMWTNIDIKADKVHVNALFDDIYKHIAILDEDLDFMINVCKVRPGSKHEKRTIKHKEPCICCDSPPKGTPEELLENHPKKSRSTNSLAHKRSIGNIENKICYLNLPMPHSIEARPTCSRPCVRSLTDKKGLDSGITGQSSRREKIKCKESLASERSISNPKIKRGSVGSERSKVSRIRLNFSRGQICTGSDSFLSEDGNEVMITNLDEDVSLQW